MRCTYNPSTPPPHEDTITGELIAFTDDQAIIARADGRLLMREIEKISLVREPDEQIAIAQAVAPEAAKLIADLRAQLDEVTADRDRLDALTRCATIGCGLAGRCDHKGTDLHPCPIRPRDTADLGAVGNAMRAFAREIERTTGIRNALRAIDLHETIALTLGIVPGAIATHAGVLVRSIVTK